MGHVGAHWGPDPQNPGFMLTARFHGKQLGFLEGFWAEKWQAYPRSKQLGRWISRVYRDREIVNSWVVESPKQDVAGINKKTVMDFKGFSATKQVKIKQRIKSGSVGKITNQTPISTGKKKWVWEGKQ